MKLTNQTVLITGGTSGIGLHLAIRLHGMNNQVIICGRNQQRLQEIAQQYPGMITYTCDVRKAGDRVALSEWVISHYPAMNVLVNNAGIMQFFDLTHVVDVDKVTAEVTTNLIAPIHLGSLFAAHLSTRADAAIVNVSSGLAFTPLAAVPVYCATKAAVHSLTVSQRHQLRDTGVKVFEIIPPAVSTSLGKADGYDQSKDNAMDVEVFIDDVISVLAQDQYEVGIGVAEGLRQQREALFSMLNQ